MRLTADLITNSLSYINPLLERELDLRGHKIPIIENLGVARNQDCIDFTDNSITHLTNFPLSPRLRTLLLARNRVSAISTSLQNTVPNLSTLVLTSNQISQLADLDPLGLLKNLTHLVLIDNPVTRRPHYRHWVIWRCRNVRFLDFQKVRDAERTQATKLFGEDAQHMTDLAKEIARVKSAVTTSGGSATSDDRANGITSGRVKLTAAEKKRLEAMIRNAKSLAEIERLEKELNEGRVPAGIMNDEMDDD